MNDFGGADLLAGAPSPNCRGVPWRQIAPGSSLFTKTEHGNEAPCSARFVSICSGDDEIVFPSRTSALDGTLNIELQSGSSGQPLEHDDLLRDSKSIAAVLRAIQGEHRLVAEASCAFASKESEPGRVSRRPLGWRRHHLPKGRAKAGRPRECTRLAGRISSCPRFHDLSAAPSSQLADRTAGADRSRRRRKRQPSPFGAACGPGRGR